MGQTQNQIYTYVSSIEQHAVLHLAACTLTTSCVLYLIWSFFTQRRTWSTISHIRGHFSILTGAAAQCPLLTGRHWLAYLATTGGTQQVELFLFIIKLFWIINHLYQIYPSTLRLQFVGIVPEYNSKSSLFWSRLPPLLLVCNDGCVRGSGVHSAWHRLSGSVWTHTVFNTPLLEAFISYK